MGQHFIEQIWEEVGGVFSCANFEKRSFRVATSKAGIGVNLYTQSLSATMFLCLVYMV
mgnify:CR=1